LEEAMRDLFWLSDAAWPILAAGSSPTRPTTLIACAAGLMQEELKR
jgi:hypothetical protein